MPTPAVMEDPGRPALYRSSGEPPFPDPQHPGLPADIVPRQVTLRDRQTVATIVPFADHRQIPASLVGYLCDQLNKEIEGGDTYPMTDVFNPHGFAAYWFQTFGAVMLLGDVAGAEDLAPASGPASATNGDEDDYADRDWAKECLGSFYIKPNYPGRSSHVCNAGFLVTDASRNRGVGRLMGEAYIDWAPRLGYTYSVFNLVYETNVASCRIWDALGFKRIGRIKGCGSLRSHPGRLIDAIIYGRDLAPGESEELVSEERFDKIKFYLKYGKYPNGADRAEKSRLRSAATHYKLLEGDKLMLKDKEVISDPARQYDIARAVHVLQHHGINKTTATIAEKYHWSRIKETVSDVIRNCGECKELGKAPNPVAARKAAASAGQLFAAGAGAVSGRSLTLQNHVLPALSQSSPAPGPAAYADPNEISAIPPSHTLKNSPGDSNLQPHRQHPHLHQQPQQQHQHQHQHQSQHHHPHNHNHNPMLQDPPPSHHESATYQPIDPQIINQPPDGGGADGQHDNPFEHYHSHADDFQALLNATEDVVPGQHPDGNGAVDQDLDMLMVPDDEDEDI